MKNVTEMTDAEKKAHTITRKTGIKNINEAIDALHKAGVEHNFSPFRPIEILEQKRWDLCQEIRRINGEVSC